MYHDDNMTEPDRPEFDEMDRLAPKVKGLGLVSGDRDVPPAPLQQAFSRNEQVISELEMAIQHLESKVSPIRVDAPRAERDTVAQSKPQGNSPVTRAMEDLSDRLYRSVIQVCRLTEELEL